MVRARRLVGLVVEKRILTVPVSIPVSAKVCEEDPIDCCPCCEGVNIPETLWLVRSTGDVACECIDECIELNYNTEDHAWYSGVVDDTCMGLGLLFRLRCHVGEYQLDLVNLAHVVQLAGVVTLITCSPFDLIASFDDAYGTGTGTRGDPIICGGQFLASISEEDCTSPPPTIVTDCCPAGIPATLHVTVSGKTGDCTCLPNSFTLTWTGAAWTNVDAMCGINQSIRLACNPGGATWNFSGAVGAGHCVFNSTKNSWVCTPFSVTFSGVSITGCCTGTANFSITE